MISLKKHLDSKSKAARPDLAQTALELYRNSVTLMGQSCARVCPPVGFPVKNSLLTLADLLAAGAGPAPPEEIARQIDDGLSKWGDDAHEYFRQKAADFRDIMLTMAKTADTVGEAGQRHGNKFSAITSRLQSFADLQDLPAIRAAVMETALEMQACVESMTAESQESIGKLRAELTSYQVKLEEAERMVSLDALTGLASRRCIELQIDLRVGLSTSFSVMIIDLNGFKQINDVFGHLAGDNVLKLFSAELRAAFRKTDLVGRWGGDEFIVLLDVPLAQAAGYIERVREWVFGDYTVQQGASPLKVHVEAAIGVAHWKPGEPVERAISRADAEMYKDKSDRKERALKDAKPGPRR